MNPMMVNLENVENGINKPKYIVSIRQANNGYAVEVFPEIIRKLPMSPEEAQRKISTFIQGLNEKFDNPPDVLLSNLLDKAKQEEKGPQIELIGLHVFKTLKELNAFLSFVYEEDGKD